MKLNKRIFLVRTLSLALFVITAFHFIATWLYFFINPFVSDYLAGFTWLGILVNLVELFYCIWFCEYFNENKKGE